MMPNKTIYVSDTDLPVFERAQELAGENLSSTIVQALRNFVQSHEARTAGFRDIVVRVGSEVYTRKQFRGRLLAKGHVETPAEQQGPADQQAFGPQGDPEDEFFDSPWEGFGKRKRGGPHRGQPNFGPFGPRGEASQSRHKILEVYQTARERIALYTRELPDWWQPDKRNRRWERDWWRWERDYERMMEHTGWAAQWGNWRGKYSLEDFDTLEDVKDRIPAELYAAAKQALTGNTIESLDI